MYVPHGIPFFVPGGGGGGHAAVSRAAASSVEAVVYVALVFIAVGFFLIKGLFSFTNVEFCIEVGFLIAIEASWFNGSIRDRTYSQVLPTFG
jgi:hypothetical protein